MADGMVIFTRTFDLLTWIIPVSARFPAHQRFAVTKRLQDAVLDFQEALFEANAAHGKVRLTHLQRADVHLNKVRLYLRLAHQMTWLNAGQYEHVSRMVAEIGRLLGGWVKSAQP